MKRALLLGVVAHLYCGVAVSQAPPDTLVWERIGSLMDVDAIFTAPDTSVYVTSNVGVSVLYPGEEEWTLITGETFGIGIGAIPEGPLFVFNVVGLERSTDGGQTWRRVLVGGGTVPFPTSSGALLIGEEDCCGVARSTDGGARWTTVDMEDHVGFDLIPFAFAALPPSEAFPQGRIVGAGRGGVVYSDDDGLSWHATELVQAFNIFSQSVVRGADGVLYAAVNALQAGAYGGVFRSTNGAEWELVGTIPLEWDYGYQLVATPDSALYALAIGQPGDFPLYRSRDGGRTWAEVGPVWEGWPMYVNEVALGPDGRLWAAAERIAGHSERGGVFRTTEPVFVVGGEAGPQGATGALRLLSPYPNPSRGRVTVPIELGKGADVEVQVVDVLGREVALLHKGPLGGGRHVLHLDGSALPVGAYVLRVTAAGETVTTRVVFVR